MRRLLAVILGQRPQERVICVLLLIAVILLALIWREIRAIRIPYPCGDSLAPCKVEGSVTISN